MKTILTSFALCFFISIFFNQCSNTHLEKSANKFYPVSKITETETEAEDGIKEAQDMEFKLTRDVSLGYIPKDRLIKATNAAYFYRKNNAAYR